MVCFIHVQFIINHPKFSNNPFYVTGISYSGTVVPIITEAIYQGMIVVSCYVLLLFNYSCTYVTSLDLTSYFLCPTYIVGYVITLYFIILSYIIRGIKTKQNFRR